MLQALIKKGKVTPNQVPAPTVSDNSLLIKVMNSCISTGTELSGVVNSGKSLIRRALEQPENVARVLDMARTDGLKSTLMRVKGKIAVGQPTGYTLSGVVIGVGEGVKGFNVGDRVTAAGAGIANHAEYVDVPVNLVVKMPDELNFEKASTVALGSIAMHGVRRCAPGLGEYIAIVGLGALGQLALQMCKLAGARVIAVDYDTRRLEIASKNDADLIIDPNRDDPEKIVKHYTGGRGCDAVIFTAATSDPAALSSTFAMCRRKGRVVMIGVYGKELNRDDIYKKEIEFLISTSYGPGRYDDAYEQDGLDYPYAYVRWTENRNMAEYLRLLETEELQIDDLIEGTFDIEEVEAAYAFLQEPQKPLLVTLSYGRPAEELIPATGYEQTYINPEVQQPRAAANGKLNVAIVGAGGFATAMHLPNLLKLKEKFRVQAIMSRSGNNAAEIARQNNAAYSTTDYDKILGDPEIHLVMICTRHNLHADMSMAALQAGKHVFVEKPLAVAEDELLQFEEFYDTQDQAKPVLMIGFNRRFSKYMVAARNLVKERINPLYVHYRMNAGYIPLDHWVHGKEGGGRIIGEGCHIIDLFNYLIGSTAIEIAVSKLRPVTGSLLDSDNRVVTLTYADGSVATLEYFAVGSKQLSKEYLEVHFDEKSLVMDNYQALKGYGLECRMSSARSPQKGHLDELTALHRAITASSPYFPIPLADMLETSRLTILAGQ